MQVVKNSLTAFLPLTFVLHLHFKFEHDQIYGKDYITFQENKVVFDLTA